MKRLFLILLMLCFLLCSFAGCAKDNKPEGTETPTVSATEPEPIIPELTYTDVTNIVLGNHLGKSPDACGLPEDSVFITGDGVCGYDYVSVDSVQGNLTCYYSDNGVYSFIFGSAPFEGNDEFNATFQELNAIVANGIAMEISEPVYTGAETEDSLTAMFEGKGVLTSEYTTERAVITVTGCGVNGVATVAIECRSLDKEG